jgi:hypothetical protein
MHDKIDSDTRSALAAVDLTDKTKWSIVCPTVNEATRTYLVNAEPHIRCVACVRALANSTSPDTRQLSPEPFPFVIGYEKTDGLLTVASFATAMSARHMFDNGNPADKCARLCVLGMCTQGNQMWHLFHMLDLLDSSKTESNAEVYHNTAFKIAAHAKHCGNNALFVVCLAHATNAYRHTISVLIPGISAKMIAALAADTETERVTNLFKSVTRKMLAVHLADIPEGAPCSLDRIKDVLKDIACAQRIPALEFITP